MGVWKCTRCGRVTISDPALPDSTVAVDRDPCMTCIFDDEEGATIVVIARRGECYHASYISPNGSLRALCGMVFGNEISSDEAGAKQLGLRPCRRCYD